MDQCGILAPRNTNCEPDAKERGMLISVLISVLSVLGVTFGPRYSHVHMPDAGKLRQIDDRRSSRPHRPPRSRYSRTLCRPRLRSFAAAAGGRSRGRRWWTSSGSRERSKRSYGDAADQQAQIALGEEELRRAATAINLP